MKNISNTEQRVMDADGVGRTVAPGAEAAPAFSDSTARELLAAFPSVWAVVPVNPKKKKEPTT